MDSRPSPCALSPGSALSSLLPIISYSGTRLAPPTLPASRSHSRIFADKSTYVRVTFLPHRPAPDLPISASENTSPSSPSSAPLVPRSNARKKEAEGAKLPANRCIVPVTGKEAGKREYRRVWPGIKRRDNEVALYYIPANRGPGDESAEQNESLRERIIALINYFARRASKRGAADRRVCVDISNTDGDGRARWPADGQGAGLETRKRNCGDLAGDPAESSTEHSVAKALSGRATTDHLSPVTVRR
ncbi:hypothetical protein KM043_004202 [Ampulex compressa]|nr:hypothetical protein KM043_004202 [Ampulex compressa]